MGWTYIFIIVKINIEIVEYIITTITDLTPIKLIDLEDCNSAKRIGLVTLDRQLNKLIKLTLHLKKFNLATAKLALHEMFVLKW